MECHENPYVLTCPWEEIQGSLLGLLWGSADGYQD